MYFFGELKSDRKNYLNHLKKTNINLVSYENMRDKLSDQEVVDLINKSKIILNFSKGGIKYSKNQVYYQFKGRIQWQDYVKHFVCQNILKVKVFILKKISDI